MSKLKQYNGTAWVPTVQGAIGYTGSIGVGYTGSASTVVGYTGSQGIIGYTGSASTVIGYTGSKGADGGGVTTGKAIAMAIVFG